MHPLQNGSQVTERPANKPVSGLPGYFTESGENNVPSYPGADWFNHVIDEFLNVLSLMGIQYDPDTDLNLTNALKKFLKTIFILIVNHLVMIQMLLTYFLPSFQPQERWE